MKNRLFPLLLAGGAAVILFSGKSKSKGAGTETAEVPDSDVGEGPGGQGDGEEPVISPGDVPGEIGPDGPEVGTTTGTKNAAATGSATKGAPITPKSEPKPTSSKPGAGKTAPKKPSAKPKASPKKPADKPKTSPKSKSTGSTTKVPKEIARAVQQALMTLGYSLPRYGADGDWGNETKSAMRNFQRDQSLPQTGTLTTETVSALDRAMHQAAGNKDEMCFSIDECNDLIVKGAIEARFFQPILENNAGQAVRGVLKKVDLLALAQAEAYFDRHGKWPWE